ncbi:MAG: acetylglutamate kinase [Bacteroidetes bacterium]|nr:MAG: acetylglutamate kinase [Bacteroidota bacterium]
MSSSLSLRILKIGGNVLADHTQLDAVLQLFSDWPDPAILVHGGGKSATDLAHALGIEAQLVEGRRITDEKMLEIVTMVYAGLINKKLVAALQAKQCNAIGLSGADGNLIRAHQRIVQDIDYGFAGDIDEVNTQALQALLATHFRPVFCAITHDQRGQLLNTNADTIAASLATALAPHFLVSLQYCFEKTGVLRDADDEQSLIRRLDRKQYQSLRVSGAIHSGMIPKLDNAFAALTAGVSEIVIGNVASLSAGTATVIRGE